MEEDSETTSELFPSTCDKLTEQDSAVESRLRGELTMKRPVLLLFALAMLAIFSGSVPSVMAAEDNKPSRAPGLYWADISGKKYGAADIASKKATLFIFSS